MQTRHACDPCLPSGLWMPRRPEPLARLNILHGARKRQCTSVMAAHLQQEGQTAVAVGHVCVATTVAAAVGGPSCARQCNDDTAQHRERGVDVARLRQRLLAAIAAGISPLGACKGSIPKPRDPGAAQHLQVSKVLTWRASDSACWPLLVLVSARSEPENNTRKL